MAAFTTFYDLSGNNTQLPIVLGSLTSSILPYPVTDISSVAIGTNVTDICNNVFFTATQLNSITFETGSNLVSIGTKAFGGSSLPTIAIPSTVTTIGYEAFSQSDLSTITFDAVSTLASIEHDVFSLTPLEEIIIPASVITIDDDAFTDATVLNSVIFEANSQLTTIAINAFKSTNALLTITIPALVTFIGDYAFNNSVVLTSVTFESNLNLLTIGANAFNNTTSLTTITIPSSVTTIGDAAFYSSAVDPIIFDDNSQISSISTTAFTGLNNISVYMTDNTLNYLNGSIAYNLSPKLYFNTNNVQLFFGASSVAIKALTTFTKMDGTIDSSIITGTLNVGNYPSGWVVTDIKSLYVGIDVTAIGLNAFNGATNLTTLTISSSVETIGLNAFFGSGLQTITFEPNSKLNAIGYSAFQDTTSLQTITIPSTVTTIGNQAFFGSGLQTITFEPNSKLNAIGIEAFRATSGLQTITIPSTVTTIGNKTFFESGLQTIIFEDNSNLHTMDSSIFTDLTNISVYMTDGTLAYLNQKYSLSPKLYFNPAFVQLFFGASQVAIISTSPPPTFPVKRLMGVNQKKAPGLSKNLNMVVNKYRGTYNSAKNTLVMK